MNPYLPEDIRRGVAEAARAYGMSEEAYMREAIRRALNEGSTAERPPLWGDVSARWPGDAG